MNEQTINFQHMNLRHLSRLIDEREGLLKELCGVALARQRGNSCLSQLFTTQEQITRLLLPGSPKLLEYALRRAL